jgi:hypothetical protein
MRRIEWDFSKGVEAMVMTAFNSVADEGDETRAKMMLALEQLGYEAPLLSERMRAYRRADVDKWEAHKYDWQVSREYFDKRKNANV